MVRTISRKDLYKQDFTKAVIEHDGDSQQHSMMGFAEAMYYFYKQENNVAAERDN